MPDFGQQLLSFNPGIWPGVDHESVADRGELRLRRIINGYVRGKEIRTWPGFRTAVNPVPDALDVNFGVYQPGYRDLAVDAERPVARRTLTADKFPIRIPTEETMRVWADVASLHSMHYIRGRHVLIGESKLRVEPVLDGTFPTIPLEIISWDDSPVTPGQVRVQFSGTITPVTGSFNNLELGDCLYIEGAVSGNPAADASINGKGHFVVNIAAGGVTLQTPFVAASGVLAQFAVCGRTIGNRSGNLSTGRTVYGEILDADRLQDKDALTSWWVDDDIDVDAHAIPRNVFASYVANRQRDYCDETRLVAPLTGVHSRIVEGHVPFAFLGFTPVPNWGITRRPTLELPYRISPAMAGDRIVMAVRGYACMFQVPALVPISRNVATNPTDGAYSPHNSVYDKPRSLGVPKGLMLTVAYDKEETTASESDPTFPTGGIIPDGTTGANNFWFRSIIDAGHWPAGTYRMAVAYRDDATGEIGDLSEVWQFTLPDAATEHPGDNSWDIFPMVMHPGYVLAECLAMSVMVFMSKPNEDEIAHLFTFQLEDQHTAHSAPTVPIPGSSQSSLYGLQVRSTHATGAVESEWVKMFYRFQLPLEPLSDDTLYNYDVVVPDFRNMPRGSKFVAITRGARISGGIIGSYGRDSELMPGTLQAHYHVIAATNFEHWIDRVFSEIIDAQNRNLASVRWPTGNGSLPSSYGGIPIHSRTLWPYPLDRLPLDRMLNCQATFTGGTVATRQIRALARRWKTIEGSIRFKGEYVPPATVVYLQQFRSQAQTSELGEPGLAIALGDIIVDAKRDDDLEAGREYRGVQILCTRRQTFSLSWNVGPAGVTPFTVSNEHGCIAPNSMAEGDQVLGWISDRGPVAYTPFGTVAPIGRQYTRDFYGRGSRFLRDSKGMMLHSWGAHDEQRGLLLFGMFENRAKGTANEVQVYWKGNTYLWDDAPNEAKSRFPCDVVLVYAEAEQAWSEWHPPSGLEVLWMAPLTCKDGQQRMGFMAADKRVYVLDDDFGDTNKEPLILTVGEKSTGTVIEHSLSLGATSAFREGVGSFIRDGAEVLIYDANNELKYRTTGSSVAGVPGQIQVAATVSVVEGDKILVMPRTMTIETTFINRKGDAAQKIDGVILRGQPRSRVMHGTEDAVQQPLWAKATCVRQAHPSGRHGGGATLRIPVNMQKNALGSYIGCSEFDGQNRVAKLEGGSSDGMEQSVMVEIFGGAQFCLQDLALTVG